MKTTPIIIENILNAPATRVWKAITDNDEMKQWYFNLSEFKPEVGFEFQFSAGPEDRIYLHKCKITEAIPDKKLAYSWQYDGYPGYSTVTFELLDEDNKTRIKLTHQGTESFPSADDPNFAKESFTAGWTEIIGTSLKEYVEKT